MPTSLRLQPFAEALEKHKKTQGFSNEMFPTCSLVLAVLWCDFWFAFQLFPMSNGCTNRIFMYDIVCLTSAKQIAASYKRPVCKHIMFPSGVAMPSFAFFTAPSVSCFILFSPFLVLRATFLVLPGLLSESWLSVMFQMEEHARTGTTK